TRVRTPRFPPASARCARASLLASPGPGGLAEAPAPPSRPRPRAARPACGPSSGRAFLKTCSLGFGSFWFFVCGQAQEHVLERQPPRLHLAHAEACFDCDSRELLAKAGARAADHNAP